MCDIMSTSTRKRTRRLQVVLTMPAGGSANSSLSVVRYRRFHEKILI
jgi:alcohol dehydrogenase YqhD (iron-dependent ADH family)